MLMAETQQRIRVFCVDDHRVMLDGLALLIGRQPDMEVVGSATHGEQAVDERGAHEARRHADGPAAARG